MALGGINDAEHTFDFKLRQRRSKADRPRELVVWFARQLAKQTLTVVCPFLDLQARFSPNDDEFAEVVVSRARIFGIGEHANPLEVVLGIGLPIAHTNRERPRPIATVWKQSFEQYVSLLVATNMEPFAVDEPWSSLSQGLFVDKRQAASATRRLVQVGEESDWAIIPPAAWKLLRVSCGFVEREPRAACLEDVGVNRLPNLARIKESVQSYHNGRQSTGSNAKNPDPLLSIVLNRELDFAAVKRDRKTISFGQHWRDLVQRQGAPIGNSLSVLSDLSVLRRVAVFGDFFALFGGLFAT